MADEEEFLAVLNTQRGKRGEFLERRYWEAIDNMAVVAMNERERLMYIFAITPNIEN